MLDVTTITVAFELLAYQLMDHASAATKPLPRREIPASIGLDVTAVFRNFHLIASACLAAALLPALRWVGLPTRFDWSLFLPVYWIILASKSIFLCAILCVIGLPREQGIGPFLDRLRTEKVRIPMIISLVALIVLVYGKTAGVLFSVIAIALLELVERGRASHFPLGRKLFEVMLPAAYFFFGFIVVCGYNDVIATLRFNGAADVALNRIDIWLMRGASVSSLSNWALTHLSSHILSGINFIYFGMYPQIGACVILLVFCYGKSRALRFVGTILIAYYIALICFYFIPATGPYFLPSNYLFHLTANVADYTSEGTITWKLAMLHLRQFPTVIGPDYFIAFPCMHLVQPLVVLWYLRRWKRIFIALAAYDFVMIACILLLAEHYVVDLIGALAVAALAIALVPETEKGIPSRVPGLEKLD